MLKIFGAQKESDQNRRREVSKANIRLEVLDPKEEKILESDSQIAYTGTWYQVTDQGAREGNYLESSATALFIYTLAKAINKGYNWQRVYRTDTKSL